MLRLLAVGNEYFVLSTQCEVQAQKRSRPILRVSPACQATSLVIAALLSATLSAQVFERPVSLPPAEIELLDASSATHLENAKRFLAERQWNEAVDAIRRVQEAEPGRL